MKLLRINTSQLPLFNNGVDISFVASQRIDDLDKNNLYNLNDAIYLNPTNSFIGKNATGKTSILKLISLCIGIINNESINHLEYKNILGKNKDVTFNIYFYSEKSKDISLLDITISSYTNNLNEIIYKIIDESLYTKSINKVKLKKQLYDFTKYDNLVKRDNYNLFLKDDISITISNNKLNNEHITLFNMIKYNESNILKLENNISLEVIKYLDSSIEKLYIDKFNNVYLKFYNQDEMILNNIAELENYLSSGTIKGIIAFSEAINILNSGGYLIIDEIENHFNREIVSTLIRFFMDIKINKYGAVLFFSTHYPRILDEYDRNDSIFICNKTNTINITNLNNLLKRNDIKRSEAYESGIISNTQPDYESYVELKKYIKNRINND